MQEEPGSIRSVLLGFGSNLGDRVSYIKSAISKLTDEKIIQHPVESSYYETEPVGYSQQPWFINSVVLAETGLNPSELINEIKRIENETGRQSRNKWHEREIDIDILILDNLIINSELITLPHPEMHRRKFVLLPAAEVSPDLVHPVLKMTLSGLLEKCNDGSVVKKY